MIVITVPHAACPPDVLGHPCDFMAPEVAQAIHKGLAGSTLIESEIHRDPKQLAIDGKPGSDQNRPWGRTDTKFKAALDKSNPTLLIDVHSFPRGGFEIDHDIEVVILDPWLSFGWDPFSHDLTLTLIKAGVNAVILRGGKQNAIVVDTRKRGIPAILLEMGEFMSPRAKELTIKAVIRWAEKVEKNMPISL